MKEKILKLREEGKSYKEIQKILKCSRSLIAYHANSTSKAAALKLQKTNRYSIRFNLKQKFGGKCSICEYSKCMAALHFHHLDSTTKLFDISDSLWSKVKVSDEMLELELKKCILVCSNCHVELHNPDHIMEAGNRVELFSHAYETRMVTRPPSRNMSQMMELNHPLPP